MREVGGSSPSSPILTAGSQPPATGPQPRPPRLPTLPQTKSAPSLPAPADPGLAVSRITWKPTTTAMSHTVQSYPGALTLSPAAVSDLVLFASGQGHPDYPCLSRTHAPASCVPCADFSPWLRSASGGGDVEAVGRVPLPDPGGQPGRRRESRADPGALRPPGRGAGGRAARPPPPGRRRGGLARPPGRADPAGGPRGLLRVHHDRRSGRLRGLRDDARTRCACATRRSWWTAATGSCCEMASEMSYWAAWPVLDAEAASPSRRRRPIRRSTGCSPGARLAAARHRGRMRWTSSAT